VQFKVKSFCQLLNCIIFGELTPPPRIQILEIKKIRIFMKQIARIMTTKLTLTIEQDVIKRAKIYAQRKGRSLSDLIENYLKTLVSNEKTEDDLSPRVKRLVGSVKLPKDFDYKKDLEMEILRKHKK
jgi:hypothetical protein